MKLPSIATLLRGHFFAGLLIVIPFAVITWILIGVLNTLWGMHTVLPGSWPAIENPTLAIIFNFGFTLAFAVALALSISIVGWTSKLFLGKKIIKLMAEIIDHIPVIRSIYGALDQLLRTIAAGGGQQFSRVVYVEYPRKGSWALAFVTGPARIPGEPDGRFINVYVPTTPNPTSGFHLILPESEVKESYMKVEEAFRTILSLGIAQPK